MDWKELLTLRPFESRVEPIGFYPLPRPLGDDEGFRTRTACTSHQTNKNVIYIHVPFCFQRCSFCLFYLHGYKGEVWKEFYTGLLTNLRMLAELPSVRCLNFGAMFIGGGSPNCFSADELRELMTVIRSLFACDDNFEATIEWYPSDLDKEKLKCAHDVGFDRISFGVQTFSERLATSIRQRHTPTDSDRIIKTAQDIGFPNVNIDIISSLPSQKWEEMENDIRSAISYQSGSVTVNPLEVIPGTPLARWIKQGRIASAVPVEERVQRIAYVNYLMKEIGFVQQRFFNFHLPGKQHRYNRISSFPRANIVAAGPGAYGSINGYSYVNHAEVGKFCGAVNHGTFPISFIR